MAQQAAKKESKKRFCLACGMSKAAMVKSLCRACVKFFERHSLDNKFLDFVCIQQAPSKIAGKQESVPETKVDRWLPGESVSQSCFPKTPSGPAASCSITPETRNVCRKCRFDSCLRAGLTVEGCYPSSLHAIRKTR